MAGTVSYILKENECRLFKVQSVLGHYSWYLETNEFGGSVRKLVTEQEAVDILAEYNKNVLGFLGPTPILDNKMVNYWKTDLLELPHTAGFYSKQGLDDNWMGEPVDLQISSPPKRVKDWEGTWKPKEIALETREVQVDMESLLEVQCDAGTSSAVTSRWECKENRDVSMGDWKPVKDVNFKRMKGRARDRAADQLALALNTAQAQYDTRIMPPPRHACLVKVRKDEAINAMMVPWHTPQPRD